MSSDIAELGRLAGVGLLVALTAALACDAAAAQAAPRVSAEPAFATSSRAAPRAAKGFGAEFALADVALATTSGDADGVLEPNEDATLANIGFIAGSGIATTLSTSTPGVVIDGASSAYPDIGVGARGVNRVPFALRVDSSVPCGTAVLAIDNTDGSGNKLCQTALDDASSGPSIQSVQTADEPFTGSFTPNAPFSVWRGENADGDWSFAVQDFFSQDDGNIRAFSITILTSSNSGNAALEITALDAAAAPFARVAGDTCGNAPIAIAPGASCTLSYAHAPTAPGAASQTITIDAGGSTCAYALTGTGTQAVVGLSSTRVDFGTQPVGGMPASRLLTLTNAGNGPVTISAIAASASFGAAGDTCAPLPLVLTANARCTVVFSFVPSGDATVVGTGTIVTDAGVLRVALVGGGVTPAVPVPGPAAWWHGLLAAVLLASVLVRRRAR